MNTNQRPSDVQIKLQIIAFESMLVVPKDPTDSAASDDAIMLNKVMVESMVAPLKELLLRRRQIAKAREALGHYARIPDCTLRWVREANEPKFNVYASEALAEIERMKG